MYRPVQQLFRGACARARGRGGRADARASRAASASLRPRRRVAPSVAPVHAKMLLQLVATGFLALRAAVAVAPVYEITLEATASGAKVPADFFGLTLDAWGMAGGYMQKQELNSSRLRNWLRTLNPVTLRVGGTATDRQVWPLGPSIAGNIATSSRNVSENISVNTWAAVGSLAKDSGLDLVVSVSGLLREWEQRGQPWSPTNAKAFLQWNIDNEIQLAGVELGNEPGIWGQFKGPPVTAQQHAADWAKLQQLLVELYPQPSTRPLAIGPDNCCNMGGENTLRAVLPFKPLWNVTTIHLYGKGPDRSKGTPDDADLLGALRRNDICERVKEQASWVANSTQAGNPFWIGEGGGSFYEWPGGGYLHQFGGALSILNTMGCSATAGLQKFLKHDIFENMLERAPDGRSWLTPRPAFFMAKLWHDIVGSATAMSTSVKNMGASDVVSTIATEPPSSCPLQAYCNCSWSAGGTKCSQKHDDGSECFCRCCCAHMKDPSFTCKWTCPLGQDNCHQVDFVHGWGFHKEAGATNKAQTVLLVLDLRNASDPIAVVSVSCAGASTAEIYTLTPSGSAQCEPDPSGKVPPCDPVLNAPTMSLNGEVLAASTAGDLPKMTPKSVKCVGDKVTLQSTALSATIVTLS